MSVIQQGLSKLKSEGLIAFLKASIRYSQRWVPLRYYWHRSNLSGTSSPRLEQNQSDSDREDYLRAVERAINTSEGFGNFKRDPDYQKVLEHVTQSQGEDYLQLVKEKNPQFLDDREWKRNDEIGNPVTYEYDNVGSVSPYYPPILEGSSRYKNALWRGYRSKNCRNRWWIWRTGTDFRHYFFI